MKKMQWYWHLDTLNSIRVRQHVSGPTHCCNHTLDLILTHEIDVDDIEILQQSNDKAQIII